MQKLIHLAQLEADSPAHAGHSIDSASPAVVQPSSSPLGDGHKERVFDAYPAPSAGPFALDTSHGGSGRSGGGDSALDMNGNANPRNAIQGNPAGTQIKPPSRQGSGHMPSSAPPPSAYMGNFLGLPDMGMGMGGYPSATSPFTFPVDPTTAPTSYPAFSTTGPSNALDPAVESILANYFPAPNGANGNGAPGGGGGMVDDNTMQGMPNLSQAPEDFLNKVFSFSWENNLNGGGGGGGGGGMMQGYGGGGMMDMGMVMPGAQGQGQGQGYQVQGPGQQQSPMQQQARQMSGSAPHQHQQQQQQMGMMGMDAFGPLDWGNNSGGWMA